MFTAASNVNEPHTEMVVLPDDQAMRKCLLIYFCKCPDSDPRSFQVLLFSHNEVQEFVQKILFHGFLKLGSSHGVRLEKISKIIMEVHSAKVYINKSGDFLLNSQWMLHKHFHTK